MTKTTKKKSVKTSKKKAPSIKKEEPKKAEILQEPESNFNGYLLTKDEKDTLFTELVGTEYTVHHALKNVGILQKISQQCKDEIAEHIAQCTRCNIWSLLSELDYEGYCEPCTSEISVEDIKSINSYTEDGYQDNYYDGSEY